MSTIGIDIGTNQCAVAIYTPQGPRIVRSIDGQENHPSVVAITEKGIRTGRSAIRQVRDNEAYTFRHIKRLLGRDYHEQEHGHYQLDEGPDGKVWFRGPDRLYSGPELIAELIKAMVELAAHHLKKPVTSAVIARPVNWHEPQLLALMEAAELAGLISAKNLPEPECAAIAFGVNKEASGPVAVYDWGGGTFDACILRCGKGAVDVIGENGRHDVGGADVDKVIEDAAVLDFAEKEGDDLRSKPHCMVHVSMKAEEAKIALSEEHAARMQLLNLTTTDTGFAHLDFAITRDELEDKSADLIEATVVALQDALKEANLHPTEIKHVLLVGGMTRMPAVHRVVEAIFGKDRIRTECEPEHAVALGAAIHGAEIDGVISQTLLEQRCGATIGIRRSNGVIYPLIPKGTALPYEAKVEIANALEDQHALSVSVWQGENSDAEDNTLVHCEVVTVEADAVASDQVRVPVSAQMDADARLEISVNGEIRYTSGGKG